MIITLVKQTPHELAYLLEAETNDDGVTLTNAQMVADLVAGPMARSVHGLNFDAPSPNSQLAARQDMLGNPPVGVDLTDYPHCEVTIQPRDAVEVGGQPLTWGVDADQDAVSPLRHELNFSAVAATEIGGATAFAIARIKFQHSLTR